MRRLREPAMDEIEPPKKHPVSNLRVFLVVLITAGLAGYAYYYFNPRTGSQQVYDNLAVFDTRLENLEKGTLRHEERVKALEENAQKAIAASTASAPSTTVSSAATAAANDASANEARVAALEKEITHLRAAGGPTQSSEGAEQAIRLLSAFYRLSGKVLGGKSFSAELSAFEDIAKPDESAGSPIAQLSPYADSGIPTFATLLGTFDQSLENLNSVLATPPPNAGFWERLKYNLTHLISIRRVDDAQAGSSPQAIVGRAQAHLEREEIEAAAAEIKSLPESARSNFTTWLDDAQMVTEAPSLMEQLQEQVMLKAFHTEPAAAKQSEPAAAPQIQTP